LFERDKAYKILEKVLSLSSGDLTEAVLEAERLTLTRFAESKISDNIDSEETILYIRIVKDKKIGVIATGDISENGVKDAVNNCEKMLKYMPPDDNFQALPQPDNVELKENKIINDTSEFGPTERAKAVELIARVGRKGGLEASGAFRIEENHLAIANSNNIRRFFKGNRAQLSMTLAGRDGNSGWAMEFKPNAIEINVSSLAKRATEKAVKSRKPVSIHDGQYTVILEPAAVGQLLLLLSFMGFGCKTMYQHRSFMTGKIGEIIAGDNFTVYEDATLDKFNYCPFDYEGVTRRRTPLVTDGVARGVVFNSYYANLMQTVSTGNALPPNNSYGPYPKTLSVAAGDSSIDDMIKSTEKGVLITHFWYLNFLNPMRTMVTGTTKDGTFLIENGQVKSAINNMRTNQSILEAFSNIEAITSDRIIYPQYSVLMQVPGMKINNFNLIAEEEENKC